MPQSLAKIYVHLVFSTKNRARFLPDEIRPGLHDYMGGTLRDLKCAPLEINTEPDHAHVLFALGRTEALSDVVGQVKRGSTSWLREQGGEFGDFYWQNGYGAFSVSASNVDEVREYVRDQRRHHQRVSFQDEFRTLLRRYEVAFDERYVWD